MYGICLSCSERLADDEFDSCLNCGAAGCDYCYECCHEFDMINESYWSEVEEGDEF